MNDYALFPKGCFNTMQDVDFVEEINKTSNKKKLVVKLHFKLDSWRTVALDHHEKKKSRARFVDLVKLIEMQKSHQTRSLGNIQNTEPKKDFKPKKFTSSKFSHGDKGSFVTVTQPGFKTPLWW